MELSLPLELKTALEEYARRQGTTPERIALDALQEKLGIHVSIEESSQEGSLADFLNGFIGVLHSSEFIEGGAQMSERTGDKFAQELLKKRKEEHL